METMNMINSRLCLRVIFYIILSTFILSSVVQSKELVVSCSENNDLYKVITGKDMNVSQYETAGEAVSNAPEGSAVMILADGYPEHKTDVNPELFDLAAEKDLRLYVEYPAYLPGMKIEKTQKAGLERGVVTADVFGPSLEKMRILMIHDCHFLPVKAEKTFIELARVAGFDIAVYGLPEKTWPVLFEHQHKNILVSSTKLSQFVTGRYAPKDAWAAVWKFVFKWLQPDKQVPEIEWISTVRPMFSPSDKLPGNAALQAIKRGTEWYENSRLIINTLWKDVADYYGNLFGVSSPPPPADFPSGDGKSGIMEGLASKINYDGSQNISWWVRDDCNAESAMALALRSAIDGDSQSKTVSANLLDFIFVYSNLQKGPRGNVNGDSFGLLDWATTLGTGTYYGDDNARAILGSLAASAALGTDKWDDFIIRAILGNFRTTGPLGFRGSRIMDDDLQNNGWEIYWKRPRVHYAPHFESWIWACYLWLYDKTGFKPILDRTKRGIRMMMNAYPDDWEWTNGIQQERARMLLPLAWLLRIEDTPEHREWIKTISDDMLDDQDLTGAIREELGRKGMGLYSSPRSNEHYGTTEATLIQENGDPVADLLYTTNFAFFSLHEAAAVTKDRKLMDASDKLADFLIRIQVQSDTRPEIHGAWFRAFDYKRWEYWGSSADIGWGPWCTESGWTQGWIVATLVLRHLKKSMWELTSESTIAEHFNKYRRLMLPRRVLLD